MIVLKGLGALFIFWCSFYSFHIFPWIPETVEWWYIPQLFTVIAINVLYIAFILEER